MASVWEKPEVQALGEERLRLLREAQEKSRGKTGMERLDVFLEYGEKLAAGGSLSKEEQNALFLALTESMSPGERQQLRQMMAFFGR